MANLIGSKPNQVPTNGSLGTMAFQDSDLVTIEKATVDNLHTGVLSSDSISVGNFSQESSYMPWGDGEGLIKGAQPFIKSDKAVADTIINLFEFRAFESYGGNGQKDGAVLINGIVAMGDHHHSIAFLNMKAELNDGVWTVPVFELDAVTYNMQLQTEIVGDSLFIKGRKAGGGYAGYSKPVILGNIVRVGCELHVDIDD